MKMKKVFLLFFLILFINLIFVVPEIYAKTAQATTKIKDFTPKIKSIQTQVQEGDLSVKIILTDANGYLDVKKVLVKKENSNYQEASFISGKGIESSYKTKVALTALEQSEKGEITIKINDNANTVEKTVAYNQQQTSGGAITGSFVTVPESESGKSFLDLFSGFFNILKSWFI